MARPIEPTPTLKGDDAKAFLKKVKEMECVPSQKVSTPKLQEAERKVREYNALFRKK